MPCYFSVITDPENQEYLHLLTDKPSSAEGRKVTQKDEFDVRVTNVSVCICAAHILTKLNK